MQPELIQELGHGISYEAYDGGKLHSIRTQGEASREATDLWCEKVNDLLQTNPSDEPLCVLYDLSHPKQTLTPYNRSRTSELAKQFPRELRAYSAVLLSKSLLNQLVAIFITTLMVGSNHKVRIFYEEAQAWEWLQDRRAEYVAKSGSPAAEA